MNLDERGLYPIYNTWHVPFWQTTTFFVIVCIITAFIVLLLICIFMRIYIRYRANRTIRSWERALREIKYISRIEPTVPDYSKQVYTLIVDTLKIYLYERYTLNLLSKTDDELIMFLENYKDKIPVGQSICDIITTGIMVKFANIPVSQEQCKQDISKALNIIQQTIPQQSSK